MTKEGGKPAAGGGKASARAQQRVEKREEKKAKRGGKDKQKNPLMQEERTRFSEELRKQGMTDDQVKTKLKAHLKDVVKPAMNEAKQGAKSKNLKGAEKKKFIQDSVRAKLGPAS